MSVFIEDTAPVSRTGRKAKKKYATKYNPKYRDDFPWALPSAKGDTFAFCHFCQVDICIRSVGAKGLRDHALTCRHSQKCQAGTVSPTGNDVMQEKSVIQTFTPESLSLSNPVTKQYQNLYPATGQMLSTGELSTVGPMSGHMPAPNQMSVESMKLQDQMNTIDQYGFSLQEHDSRYTSVPLEEGLGGTVVHVGPTSSTHSIVSQSPHSSVTNALYSVVGEDCTTMQPLYSYPPHVHTSHGMPTRDEQSQMTADKTQHQMMTAHDLEPKNTQEVLDPNQGMYQSSQSSYESGSSSSHLDKSGGLSVEDLTCNVCGTVFDNWMDLKKDLLLHIKHAQAQPKKRVKNKKHSKLAKRQNYTQTDKYANYPRRKGRPPGTKKRPIEDLNPVIESASIRDIPPLKVNQPIDQNLLPEHYFAPQTAVVAPSMLPSVQEIPLVTDPTPEEMLPIAPKPLKKSNCFSCRVCQAFFTSRPLLKDHLKLTHNNGRPFQCDVCKKFFTKKSNLEVHQKHKHSGEENACKCNVCGKVLSTRTNLRIHLRIHEGKKPFGCKECSKRFNRKANLEMHVVYHTGERKFTCEMCGKSFFAINALKRHRKLHTGERDYVCKLCGSTYVTATDLRRHMLKHNDVKPFPCTLCDKQFTRSHDLKVHVRYHNKDHQFTCPDCKKKFVESGNYRRHLRRHTGERPYACSHCFQTFTQVHHFKVHVQNQHKDGEECARNRLANAIISDKNKPMPVQEVPNQNNDLTVLSQMAPHVSPTTILTPVSHQQMTNVINSVHTMHGPGHQAAHPGPNPQCQVQINSTPGGVIHQYNYVYNSSMVPHYHTIFDVCPHTEEQ